ncbi:uncharacterized protein LOC141649309 [Silene latifolia]|uniref:uncharacterized protein LOC141649309 n=1 Tax=Silene latifolia TaxID=37657 RepID=UPI003D7784ED
MSKQANTTLLALISKKPVVTSVMDYMPLACCTVLYKTVSKILCERLKPLLPNIVGKMLQVYNFPPQFKSWLMGCITSTWFSVKINGSTTGFFKGASGLRQGDPLSPFIFVMNDLMIFVRGDSPSVKAVSDSLDLFAQMSGLRANPDRTNIYMGSIGDGVRDSILRDTGYVEGTFPFRYLGVPLNEGKLNKPMFVDLLNKYWCATLLIPKGVHKLLTKFYRNFLWNSEEGKRKMVLKSWASCYAPYQEGGYNIKEILSWNKCIMCKWIWAIEIKSDGMWSAWNYKYNIKTVGFWTMDIKPHHSEGWRSILMVRNELITRAGSIENAKQILTRSVQAEKLNLSLLYENFREKASKISWARGVWNRTVLPKHGFIMVLAMQGKLATADKLNQKGQCIWLGMRERTGNMRKELKWIARNQKRRHWKARWFSSSLTAIVYCLWEERNNRIFRDEEHCTAYILRHIQYVFSVRLLYVTHPKYKDEVVGYLNA